MLRADVRDPAGDDHGPDGRYRYPTDPDFARRGIGRLVLGLCEDAARSAGFSRVELMGTMAGVPLYEACGYTGIEQVLSAPINGVCVPLLRMTKRLPELR